MGANSGEPDQTLQNMARLKWVKKLLRPEFFLLVDLRTLLLLFLEVEKKINLQNDFFYFIGLL